MEQHRIGAGKYFLPSEAIGRDKENILRRAVTERKWAGIIRRYAEVSYEGYADQNIFQGEWVLQNNKPIVKPLLPGY